MFCSSYNEKTQVCDLAFLDFLEDPDVGDIALDIFIDMNTIPTINMYCRGGHRCCHRGNLNLCGVGDGDWIMMMIAMDLWCVETTIA